MKKILKVLFILIAIFIVIILYISYIDNNNQNYLDNIEKNIKENYNISDDITYTNQYGNYYIIKTTNNVIVLTKDYKEILKEKTSVLKDNTNNYALIYKTNKLMYENTTSKKNTIIYEYYDAKTGKLLKKTTMEKK